MDLLQDPDTVRNLLARSLEVAGRGSEQVGEWRLIPRWKPGQAVTMVSWPRMARQVATLDSRPAEQADGGPPVHRPPLAETA